MTRPLLTLKPPAPPAQPPASCSICHGAALGFDMWHCDRCGVQMHSVCYWGRVATLDEWREFLDLRIAPEEEPAGEPTCLCAACRVGEAEGKPSASAAHADLFRIHPVAIALSRARAARLLITAAHSGRDYLQLPDGRLSEADADEAMGWIGTIADEALDEALVEAENALRRSLTPEEIRAQVIGATP